MDFLENTCVHCKRYHRHKIVYDKIDSEYIIEVKDKCKTCAKAFRRKKWLQDQLLDNEWELFGLKFRREYFDP